MEKEIGYNRTSLAGCMFSPFSFFPSCACRRPTELSSASAFSVVYCCLCVLNF
jgi:hypothetical protein